MSAVRPSPELSGEREIDLRRWWQAILANRWVVVIGLVAGLVIGGLYSLSGGSSYAATVTIQPAQPFSPSGGSVLNYASSPLAIQEIATSTPAIDYVAARVGMPPSSLRGHVTTTSISTGTGPVTTRGTVLIQITVTVPNKLWAERAANDYGSYIKRQTESQYVSKSINVYVSLNTTLTAQLTAENALVQSYEKALAQGTFDDPVDKLILTANLSDAVQRQGELLTQIATNTQQLTLARDIEVAQVIGGEAKAQKITSRSRKDSVVFGGLIGIIIGLLVALGLGLRSRPSAPAH